ncbi:NAD(P)/FAD-dependent oxidoreductase [Cellulomonas hominis]|uniref:NAD(P)/FAD-dependent oxidoreductase n=1 Tax=Cellulomonas hominis TaxID=156981 RepID=UPI001B9EDF1C|nr:FAD-binding oxidoreductase [Cellulomonas hominis]VTR78973.1 Gamma-glutamylputrescine oxidoreductase [Cellulomonas hominis]
MTAPEPGPAPAVAWTAGRDLAGVSLWFDQVAAEAPVEPREPLDGDTTADVVVVGAGLTGLWTAYYLLEADPALDVLVVEQAVAGYGASGRNGGWCSALLPTSAEALARRHGAEAARSMRAAMRDTVVEVGGVAAAEEIACDFAYGGTVTLARTPAQLARLSAEAEAAGRWGDELDLLSAEEVATHVRADGVLGGTWTPDCARVQPARLVRGLADVVTARGVRLVEGTRALRISPRAVVTDHGTVRARHVVRAVEAWTAALPGHHRDLAPVYSLMIATEPLPASVWDVIGLDRGQTFTDGRHLVVYGQRTADDRLAFGGRGAPYHRGSAIEPAFDQDPRVTRALRRTLVDLFPAVRHAEITHAWGGPLGVPRDWHASVGLDEDGIAWAGGYVGDGVGASNLAGRTLADLLTGTDSALTRLPWVGHRSPRWEPEPLRWAGITAGLRAAALADREERLTGRASRVAAALAPLLGH